MIRAPQKLGRPDQREGAGLSGGRLEGDALGAKLRALGEVHGIESRAAIGERQRVLDARPILEDKVVEIGVLLLAGVVDERHVHGYIDVPGLWLLELVT